VTEQHTLSRPGLHDEEAQKEQKIVRKIRREEVTLTEFGAHLGPKLRVEPGERFLIETQDAFFGQIKTEEDLPVSKRLPPGIASSIR